MQQRIQRKCGCQGTCGSCDTKKKVQRHARTDSRHDRIPDEVLSATTSGGTPLDASTRAFMESRFAHDFSRVRIHTGSRANDAATSIDAHAYTFGHDIVFNSGAYSPSTASGRRLLAHELTHVVQQDRGTALQLSSSISTPHDASEVEADRAADAVMNGSTPHISAAPAAPLQRAAGAVRSCSNKGAAACIIHLHPEEQNAYLAAQQIQREYCVNFVSLGAGKSRTISVPGISQQINANRIFSNDPQVLACHAFSSKTATAAEVKALISWRDTTLRPAIDDCTGGSGPGWNSKVPVVAMHNNTNDSYSFKSYKTGTSSATSWQCLGDIPIANISADPAVKGNPSAISAAKAPVPGREDPDNFLVVTQNKDFNRFKSRFNVVQQSPEVAKTTNPGFDASLSVAMASSQYINVEAQEKPFSGARYAANLEMAREVMNALGVPRRKTPVGTCEEGSTKNGACNTSSSPAPAPKSASALPAHAPASCGYFTSKQMLIDAKEEWRRRIDTAALDSSGHVTTAAAKWLTGQSKELKGLDPTPLKEAEAMQACMLETMRKTAAAPGKGPKPLTLAGTIKGRMHRSYDEQRKLWNPKWDFTKTTNSFDRITPSAISYHKDCASLPKHGKWEPANPTHQQCWNHLPMDLRAHQIMQASAAPGVSRHHWGTDFDFAELNADKWAAGKDWEDEGEWLEKNAQFFGFIQSFAKKAKPGEARHMPEPWHWSYWPAAQAIVEFTLAHTADIEKALIAKWSKEGPVAAGQKVAPRFEYALANWIDFLKNVQTAPPGF